MTQDRPSKPRGILDGFKPRPKPLPIPPAPKPVKASGQNGILGSYLD